MRELFDIAAVLQQTTRLVAMIPDGVLVLQHICSNPCEERLFVMGMTHFHIIDGKIVDEWVVYDELAMLVQIQLGAMAAAERSRPPSSDVVSA